MKRINCLLAIVIMLICGFSLAKAEYIGDSEIHRANGWIEKCKNYPSEVVLGKSEFFTFTSYLRKDALIDGRWEAINLNSPEWKNSSAWATIQPFGNPDEIVKSLSFTMNGNTPLKIIIFKFREAGEEKENTYISILFPLDQKDVNGETYKFVAKNISNKVVKFDIRNLTNLPSLRMNWERYYGSVSVMKMKLLRGIEE